MFRQPFQVTIQKFMPQTHIGMTTYSALKTSYHSPKYNRDLHHFSLIIVSNQFDFNLISRFST
jgi:stress-induced morphogen